MEIREFSMDLFSLAGKVAIVTGGNTGLGQAFALALAKAGADLFIPTVMDDAGRHASSSRPRDDGPRSSPSTSPRRVLRKR